MSLPVVALALLLLLMGGAAFASVRRIPQGHVFTVHRFGRFRRTLSPGLHFLLPLFDRVVHRVNLIGHVIEFRRRVIACADMAPLEVEGALYYQILDPSRAGAALDSIDDLVVAETAEAMAGLAARHEAQEMLDSGREALNSRLKAEANTRLKRHGVLVTRCQLNLRRPSGAP
ncbi:MAG TPA: SPFH domain-containing protein [Xanthomonadaceae bacterium]|nr:SPFH domain-containing protein [Xanthomonadaceae bacterium]